jgi:hypothetical protein
MNGNCCCCIRCLTGFYLPGRVAHFFFFASNDGSDGNCHVGSLGADGPHRRDSLRTLENAPQRLGAKIRRKHPPGGASRASTDEPTVPKDPKCRIVSLCLSYRYKQIKWLAAASAAVSGPMRKMCAPSARAKRAGWRGASRGTRNDWHC